MKARRIEVEKGGAQIAVQPKPSRNRVRLNSHVKIETYDNTLEGDVKQLPTLDSSSITLERGRIRSPSEVVSLHVQRFNELDNLLERRAKFFHLYH